MQPFTQVRLKDDVGRIGFLGEESRERNGRRLCKVVFADGQAHFIPEDQLEPLPTAPEDPIELLTAGKFAEAQLLHQTLTTVRLTGKLANVLHSMDMTGTDFYAYQFKPIVKLLNSPTRGLLIADEVGLGKTIEAGLLWTELRARFNYRRLLVVCPAMLRTKWVEEFKKRFGVQADMVGAHELHERLIDTADGQAPAGHALVCSMQGLRPQKGWGDAERAGGAASELARFLTSRQHEEPLLDLLIIDEAHYMRNRETMTSQLGRLLRDVSHYVVLLSATPIHLRSTDLFQLLNMADEDLFDRPEAFDSILEANGPLVEAREHVLTGQASPEAITRILAKAAGHHLMRGNRQLESLLSTPLTEADLRDHDAVNSLARRIENINLLGHVLTRTRKREVTEWRVIREPIPEVVSITEEERAFYEAVTGTVRQYASRTNAHTGFLLVTPQRQMSSSMPAALRAWQQRLTATEDELAEDLGDDPDRTSEDRPVVEALVERAATFGDFAALRNTDSKYTRLRTLLQQFLATHPSEKVVLFSYFRATLRYLHERLSEDGVQSIVLQGGEANKDAVLARFAAANGPSVLLSSEVGSEGIDLQFCRILVNYDLPWNPMRVEQRIGRLDRLGQAAKKIIIWNLFYEDTIDARIYDKLYERLEIFERTLGGLEPILGETIRTLTLDLLTGNLTPEEESARIDQTSLALSNRRQEEELLEEQARSFAAFGDFILNEVKAARDLSRHISSEDLRQYVTTFVGEHFPGSEVAPVSGDSDRWRISLSPRAQESLDNYVRRERLDGLTRLTMNEPRSTLCRFDNTVLASKDPRVETINQLHPLIRFIGERLREPGACRYPAIAVRLDRSACGEAFRPGMYVFGAQLWSISGLQDIEHLFFSAALDGENVIQLSDADAEKLVMSAAKSGRTWLAARTTLDLDHVRDIANDVCLAHADRAYDVRVAEVQAQNEDRADIQERSITRHYESRRFVLTSVRDRHVAHGRMPLARATEAQLASLGRQYERERIRINSGRNLTKRKLEACVGVICVEAEP